MSPPLQWPCFLTSMSTMALFPYFYGYYGPVVLLPRLLWPYCLTSTSIVVLLPCVFSASTFHTKTPIVLQLLVCKKIFLFTLETYLIGYLDPKNI